MPKLKFKHGPKSTLPKLDFREPAITDDTEEIFVGGNTQNIQLAKQTDLETTNTNVGQKTDKSYVDDQLSQKANQTDLDSVSSQVTANTTSLAQKANQSDLLNVSKIQSQAVTSRGYQDSLLSVTKSKAVYDDTASSIFTENFANLSNWVLDPTPGMQVSANKLYSTGTGSGTNGGNHSFALQATDNLRAVFKVTIPAGNPTGNIIIGVSKDNAGVAPAASAVNVFGLILTGDYAVAKQWDGGTQTTTPENVTPTAGDYIVTVTVDQQSISVVMVKTDGTIEISAKRNRSGFTVNNLYLFNSDTRALSGMYISLVSARKGIATITPRTYGEGLAKTEHWTGDGTQNFKIFLPANYDSRIPAPLAICFHGHGSNETAWSIGGADSNYGKLQKALTDAGYIVLSCSLIASYTSWGNTASSNAYYQAYKYVRDHYAIGAVVFFGNSMGGIESLNTLSENKIPCVAWAGTSATYNLKYCYQNCSAGIISAIQGAYNIAGDGSNYAAQTAGRDPALMPASTFRGLPMWMASALDDTTISKANNADLLYQAVQNVSVEAVKVDVATGGHGFDIAPYTSQIVNFFNKYVNS
jgi:pimeloyl-ACP methyl ester carboxylesterase